MAQLERADWLLERRREVFGWYRELLGLHDALELQPELPHTRHACWMFSVLIRGDRIGFGRRRIGGGRVVRRVES